MGQILLAAAGLVFLMMGSLHGVLTLRDVVTPRAFTPTDDSVRLAMQGTQVAFNRRLNLWQAWLGFNLSHSLGVVLFGGVLLLLASVHFAAFAASYLLQAVCIGFAAAYFAVSICFWFRGPVLGSGFSLACIVAAVVFS